MRGRSLGRVTIGLISVVAASVLISLEFRDDSVGAGPAPVIEPLGIFEAGRTSEDAVPEDVWTNFADDVRAQKETSQFAMSTAIGDFWLLKGSSPGELCVLNSDEAEMSATLGCTADVTVSDGRYFGIRPSGSHMRVYGAVPDAGARVSYVDPSGQSVVVPVENHMYFFETTGAVEEFTVEVNGGVQVNSLVFEDIRRTEEG